MNLRDCLFVIGFCIAATGLLWIHPPTALVIIGVAIAGVAVAGHLFSNPKDNP